MCKVTILILAVLDLCFISIDLYQHLTSYLYYFTAFRQAYTSTPACNHQWRHPVARLCVNISTICNQRLQNGWASCCHSIVDWCETSPVLGIGRMACRVNQEYFNTLE